MLLQIWYILNMKLNFSIQDKWMIKPIYFANTCTVKFSRCTTYLQFLLLWFCCIMFLNQFILIFSKSSLIWYCNLVENQSICRKYMLKFTNFRRNLDINTICVKLKHQLKLTVIILLYVLCVPKASFLFSCW